MSSNQRKIIEVANFICSLLGKVIEKQTKKYIVALKFLNASNKKHELKQIKGTSPQNLVNNLIRAKVK